VKTCALVLAALALTVPVSAENASDQGLWNKTVSFDECKDLEEAVSNQGCEADTHVFKPVQVLAGGVALFVGVGVFLKFYRVWIRGEPF
jgi:hypothetical protein